MRCGAHASPYVILAGIHRDMRLLAQVPEAFAPERTLSLDGGAPELASSLLRRLAAIEPRHAFPPSPPAAGAAH